MDLAGLAFDDDANALRELQLLWCQQQGTGLEGAIAKSDFVRGGLRQWPPHHHATVVPGGAISPAWRLIS
jgi:hypothetical protein